MIRHKQKKQVPLLAIIFAILSVLTTVGLIIITQSPQMQLLKLIGIIGYILLLYCVFFVYIYYFNRNLVDQKNQLLLLFFVNLIFITMTVFMVPLPYLLIPIPIAGMLISLMIDYRLGMITNIVISIIGAMISTTPFEFLLFFIISGSLSCLIVSQAKERNKIVQISSFVISINILLVLFNYVYQFGNLISLDLLQLIFAVLNAAISIIITMGSLPLWETLFDVVTPFKLLELTNSDQELMQRMLVEAPGTYHHSQMVSNLAQSAALGIGCNPLLARTGALYHDIGKLKKPSYFKENQNGHNPHDEIDPEDSAAIIIDHVTYGIKLANEYRLPRPIKNIIGQHQGDAMVKYFYYKAKENSQGFEIEENKYRYKGPKPQTNEAAIIMLADCVEAYVRSLPEIERFLENIEKVIDEIVQGKIEEGQLDECELKIKELPVIADSFMKVYNGLYHERVKYPDNKVGGESQHVYNN